MKVRELIDLLETFDPELTVCYQQHSEHCLMDASYIKRETLCKPRPDGWIHDLRDDKELMDYLVFPGN